MTGLLNNRQLMARLGLSAATFYRRKAQGAFRHLQVTRPVGIYLYSEAKVEAFLAGQSTVALGRRTA